MSAQNSQTAENQEFSVINSTDTIVVFDPETYKETRRLVQNTDTLYHKPDIGAQFVGGQDSLMRFLAKNIRYPKEAFEQRISGKSIVKFFVNYAGFVSEAKILRSSGNKLLDDEAIQVVYAMNGVDWSDKSWIPGVKNRKPVLTEFTLPIVFRLEK